MSQQQLVLVHGSSIVHLRISIPILWRVGWFNANRLAWRANVTVLDTYRTDVLCSIPRRTSCSKPTDLVRLDDQGQPLLLFLTLPPFLLTSADAGTLLENLGAITMTLALLPIMAGSREHHHDLVEQCYRVVARPGALAATLAMVFFPLFALGGYFTSLDVFIGLGALNDMAATVDIGFMWTVGGLMAVACVAESYPLAGNRQLASPSSASLSTMLIAFGGVTSTVAKLMGDFTEKALLDSGSEDVVMTDGGFSLTAAVLFYFGSIGVILLFLNLIRTSVGGIKVDTSVSTVSDISRYSVQRGETSIRKAPTARRWC